MIGDGPMRAGGEETMIGTILILSAPRAGWDQLLRLWELIVMIVRFLWELLKLLSGAG
jgi:hypothetical protein